ncbi:MAG: poly(ADP-ribose) glycohydrolase, partial [Planctomycetota bacterium]|nr:poly(ADP-ribose) glycohydrolase [Planctomycetota bacterium]
LDAVQRATRRIDPPTRTNIIAMAAPSGGSGDYTEREIASIFATAYTAFAAAAQESTRARGPSTRTIIHSGFWGCGAFGGNRRLMIALQALAARGAGVAQFILHAGDDAGAEEASRGIDVADTLASRCGASCALDTIVGRAVILGYRWGVSDGN